MGAGWALVGSRYTVCGPEVDSGAANSRLEFYKCKKGAWAREGGLRLAGRGLRRGLRERLLELAGVPCRGWEAAPSVPREGILSACGLTGGEELGREGERAGLRSAVV